MARLFAWTAACPLDVRYGITCYLDGHARAAQVRMGMCVPRGFICVACLNQSAEIVRCRRQGSIDLGHGAARRHVWIDRPDDQREQRCPQTTADEHRRQDARLHDVRDRAIERDDQHDAQQHAQHLRRLTVDADERRAEQAEHAKWQCHRNAIAPRQPNAGHHKRAKHRESEQYRNASADCPARIAHAGVERRECRHDKWRPVEIFIQRDDDGDGQRCADTFRQAQRLKV